MRAEPSGIKLTECDAAVVKGMLQRGDRQHDIAAWFGVNGGRIAEISTGDKFGDVAATTGELPPRGPYPTVQQTAEVQSKLLELREQIAMVLSEVDDAIARLSKP